MQDFSRRDFLKTTAVAGLGAAAGIGFPSVLRAQSAGTVKVGVLHSLSGTMAISEVSLRDVCMMAFEEINAKGGVMGKKIEPVIVDPASNWDLFAEKAKQLVLQDKVAVTFGCWTSVSRKSVLPVFENNEGLLFYQDPDCTQTFLIQGTSTMSVSGTIYAPRAQVEVAGSANLNGSQIVSDTVNIQSGTVQVNFTTGSTAQPVLPRLAQ